MFKAIRTIAGTALVGAAIIIGSGTASAVTVSDCINAGGVVIRCSEEPVTNPEKVMCPAPGKTIRIWCVGGFYGHRKAIEIFETGGHSRYH